ncbi:hypothetical protein PHMEG_00032244, partial [Phytophthora megakarya]
DKTTDAATTETGAPTALRSPSESTAASGSTTAEVINVTADCVAWTETPARATSDTLRSKGKKKLVRDDVAPAPPAEASSVAEERAPNTQESTAATTVGQPPSMISMTPRRSTGFDLTEFMSSFNPGVGSEARAQDELRLLRQELEVLRGQVAGVRQSLGVRTEPSDQGEFPAGTVVELSCVSFPEQAKKEKGEYIPPQAHVWQQLESECVGFKTTPAVLMELFSGRLGSRGLTILHFREEDEQDALEARSSNGNFSSDIQSFSRSSAGVYKLPVRLRPFMSKNKSPDPEGLPACVSLVLLYVNKWLGEALGHLQVDNPTWSGGFSSAVEAIDYKSPVWTMSLVTTLSQSGHRSGTTDCDHQRKRDVYGRREKSVPDDIRALVPTNHRGEEPCLRFLGGVMCSGGTRDKSGTKASSRRATAEEIEAAE